MEKLLHERLNEGYETNPPGSCWVKVGDRHIEIVSNDALSIAREIERYYIPRPRFEDGEPVSKGCEVEGGIVDGWCVWDDGAFTLNDEEGNTLQEADPGEFVKRPTPKVYDADGVEIKEGGTVWNKENGIEYTVKGFTNEGFVIAETVSEPIVGERVIMTGTSFTSAKPVFDAEGVRICKGDTVWEKATGDKCHVIQVSDECGRDGIKVMNETRNFKTWLHQDELTHREPDSLEKLRDFALEWSHFDNVSNSSAGDFRDAMQEVTDRLTSLIERGA